MLMTMNRGLRTLVLDDEEHRHRWFTQQGQACGLDMAQVWNATEAIIALRTGPRFDLVFLDFDLVERERGIAGPNGGTVARYIARMADESAPGHVHIHSWNPEGADEMEATLRGMGRMQLSRAEFGKFELRPRKAAA